jgi:hypothetical protein
MKMSTVNATEEQHGRVVSGHSSRYVEFVFALVVTWGLGDTLSTYFALAADPSVVELNPLVAALMAQHPLALITVKLGVTVLVGAVLLAWRSAIERVPGWRIWLGVLLTAGVITVLNNVAVGLGITTVTVPF